MSFTNHSLPYNQDDMEFTQVQYPDFNHYPSDRLADSAAEGRTVLYPPQLHPHPLFTRQENAGPSIQNRSLEPHILSPHHSVYHPPSPFTNHTTHHQQQHTPQGWPPYDHSIPQSYPQNYSYAPYPSPSPFPAPRLSPPPIHHTPIHFKSGQNNSPTSSQNQRLTLAGSLDPSTGIFYRTPEHPRLRTAQACEKCRTRKAKCSGEHPACKRCLTRGLTCEYAKEGRVRGPNKAKSKPSNSGNDSSSNTPVNIHNGQTRIGPRGRTSSANSSVGSSEYPDPPGAKKTLVKREQEIDPRRSAETARRNSPSLGEHRSSRPRPPDLQLGSASGILYRSSPGDGLNESGFPPFSRYQSQGGYGHQQVDSRQVRSMHQPQMSYHQQSPYQLHREQQMHLQKNMTAIQTHGQGQSTPSSSSSQGRLLQHGISHIQTDHLMTLGVPYSVSPIQSPSMSEGFIYPPSYLQPHQSFPQYPVGNGSHNAISAGTSGSSPRASVNGGTSAINSPLTPASAQRFVISPSASRIAMKMELDITSVDPILHGPRSGLEASASMPIEPVWIDHLGQVNAYPQLNSNSEHPIQDTDERGQNGFLDGNKHQSTQNGVIETEGDVFMKNNQGHSDSQQDHFHGQSQSHNETQHYSSLDLQMC